MKIVRKVITDLTKRGRPSIKMNPVFKGYEPFILTADTVLTAQTIMADDIKTTNMSRFPRRMTISRKQTGLIKASLRDYVNVVSGRRPSAASYDTDAQALFDRMTTPLTTGEKDVYNTAIEGLKTDGLWTKLDGLLVYYAPSEDAALENWVRDAFHGIKVPGTTLTFGAKVGFTTDGTSGINTGWNFSEAVKKAGQDSNTLIFYETNSATTVSNFSAGIYGALATESLGVARRADTVASRYYNMAALTSSTVGAADKQGWVCTTRNSATHMKLFINAASTENAVASNAPPTTNFLCSGGRNWVTGGAGVSLGSAGVHRLLAWGSGFADADYDNFKTRLNKFFTDLP